MKKNLVLVVLCVTMLAVAVPSALAQTVSNEYKVTLEKMLELSGSMASAKAVLPQMVSIFKQQSAASDAFWNTFQKKWEGKFTSKLVELYVPVYQKHLTLDDLKKIVAFYESPVGKKLSASVPVMIPEFMQIGQKLGMEIAAELQQELQAQKK